MFQRFSRPLSAAAVSMLTAGLLSVGFSPSAHARAFEEAVCEAPSSSAARSSSDREPDHVDITAAEQRRIARETRQRLAAKNLTPARIAALDPINIKVYVHVMRARDGRGNVSNSQIADQIQVLNDTFAGVENLGIAAETGFTFTLEGIDRYRNDAWFKDRESAKYRAKTRLGGKRSLNIWVINSRYFGIATFPWQYDNNPKIDGVRVDYATLPGGSITNFNYGKTATHEVGHWLGLYHTFQGGHCSEVNDEVDDTPAQYEASSGCPEGADSCTELPGNDPIHNYMDYSYDTCYDQFTPGQAERMATMWAAYRA